MKKCVMVALLLAAGTLAPLAVEGGTKAAPPQSKAYGKTLAEWLTLHAEWYLSGGNGPDHVGSVQFLPLPQGQPVPVSGEELTIYEGSLDLTLKPGTAFVLPLLLINGETYDNPNVPADTPEAFPPELITGAEIRVELDGKTVLDSDVDDLSKLFVGPIYFDQPIVYDEPQARGTDQNGDPVNALSTQWIEGVGIVHSPLSVGTHTLHVYAVFNGIPVGFDNTWNITVKK